MRSVRLSPRGRISKTPLTHLSAFSEPPRHSTRASTLLAQVFRSSVSHQVAPTYAALAGRCRGFKRPPSWSSLYALSYSPPALLLVHQIRPCPEGWSTFPVRLPRLAVRYILSEYPAGWIFTTLLMSCAFRDRPESTISVSPISTAGLRPPRH